MTRPEIRARVNEYLGVRPDPAASVATLAETALFVEDVFGLSLSDDDICEEKLGSGERIENLILQKLKDSGQCAASAE